MKTAEVKNNRIELQGKFNQKVSNLTDQDLRLKITEQEETLVQLETKNRKTLEEFIQIDTVKAKLKLLLQQSNIPFRLTNTIWFNRPDSIFFSIKTFPKIRMVS